MKPERLDEIEKLAEAATPGPWHVEPGPKSDELFIGDEPSNGRVARLWNGRTKRDANAAFIAAARTAVPELLAALRERDAEIDALRVLAEARGSRCEEMLDRNIALRARCAALEKVREAVVSLKEVHGDDPEASEKSHYFWDKIDAALAGARGE